jgi:hypothetical protein
MKQIISYGRIGRWNRHQEISRSTFSTCNDELYIYIYIYIELKKVGGKFKKYFKNNF